MGLRTTTSTTASSSSSSTTPSPPPEPLQQHRSPNSIGASLTSSSVQPTTFITKPSTSEIYLFDLLENPKSISVTEKYFAGFGEEEIKLKNPNPSLPNVLLQNDMAPALTEPLSPTNKLSSSASAASPRPISSNCLLTSTTTTSNSSDTNTIINNSSNNLNNNSNHNNNNNNRSYNNNYISNNNNNNNNNNSDSNNSIDSSAFNRQNSNNFLINNKKLTNTDDNCGSSGAVITRATIKERNCNSFVGTKNGNGNDNGNSNESGNNGREQVNSENLAETVLNFLNSENVKEEGLNYAESYNNNNINNNNYNNNRKNNKNNKLNNSIKLGPNGRGAFQLAFEESIALQATAAAATRRRKQIDQQQSLIERGRSVSNGPVSKNPMGPMCDTNTSSIILQESDLVDTIQQVVESVQQQQQSEQSRQIVEDSDGSGDASQHMDNEKTSADENTIEQHHRDLESQIFLQSCKLDGDSETNIIEDESEIVSLEHEQQHYQQHHQQEQQLESVEETKSFNEIQGDDSQDLDKLSQGTEPDLETLNLNTNTQESCASNIGAGIPEQDNSSQQSQDNTSQITNNSSQSQSMAPNASLQKDYMKDSAEMEPELGDFTSTDIDFLQVLKGFESAHAGEAALCDLAGSLALFNDDVMNYEDVTMVTKDSETKDQISELEKTHQQLQRKCDFLLRRLRKAQVRYMSKHTSEEIAGLFEWTSKLVTRKDHDQNRPLSCEDERHKTVSMRSMKSFLKRIESAAASQHSNITTPAAPVAKRNNKISRSPGTNQQQFGPDTPTSSNKMAPNSLIPQLDDRTTTEIERVAGMLQTELKQVQAALDSDATASSSGGESADEMVTYNNVQQQTKSIANRAAWRWAKDRSAIAARWHWLLIQISDLEYRIRQHNELHSQIKKTKGFVILEKSMPPLSSTAEAVGAAVSATHAATLATAAVTTSSATTAVGVTTTTTSTAAAALPASVNGYRGVLPGNSKALDCDNVSPNGAFDTNGGGADVARTRPFSRIAFRKRKLLQTANVHTISKKAARPSTIKCGCRWPMQPCGICTGRADPTAPRGLPDTMPLLERIALLDAGFHPVLSFLEDAGHNIHSEGVFRLPEWQNRQLRCSTKTILKGALSSQKGTTEREDRSNKKLTDSRRKYNRKSSQDMAANKLKNAKIRRTLHGGQSHHSAAAASSTTTTARPTTAHLLNKNSSSRKLNNSVIGTMSSSSLSGGFGGTAGGSAHTTGSATGGPSSSNNNYGNTAGSGGCLPLIGSLSGSDGVNDNNIDGNNGSLPRSKNSSPIPGYSGGGNSSSYKYERMDRRSRTSYDIDNIVIPYSVAAATRVELLPYKEIPTPKWRIVDDDDDGELDTTIKESQQQLSKNDKEELLAIIELQEDGETVDNCNMVSSVVGSEVDVPAAVEPLPPPPPYENAQTLDGDDDDGPEDISNEAMHQRHERALIEERKKFQTYLKFPWSTRSRANRRLDSRAESSGANTPDPTSPAPNTPSVGGDQESIPSPAAPSTPQTVPENVESIDSATTTAATTTTTNNQNLSSATIIGAGGPFNNQPLQHNSARKNNRQRTSSVRKEREEPSRSTTPDPRDIVPPYETLSFPLPEDVYESMIAVMPKNHLILQDCNSKENSCDENDGEVRLRNKRRRTGSGTGPNSRRGSNSNDGNGHVENRSLNNSSRRASATDIVSGAEGGVELIIGKDRRLLPDGEEEGNGVCIGDNIDSNNSVIYESGTRLLAGIGGMANNNSANNNLNNSTETFTSTLTAFEDGGDNLMDVDSDTDSAESGLPDEEEDPNDPEWREPI